MDRYIGLDVHSQTCTAAVVGPSGRRLQQQVLETHGKTLIDFVRGIAGRRHLCIEEGALAEWVYETLEHHVDDLMVVQPTKREKPCKSDAADAWARAEDARLGKGTRIFKSAGAFTTLRQAVKGYELTQRDMVRAKNRLNGLFRSRAITGIAEALYDSEQRAACIRKLPAERRQLAELLGHELDALTQLHAEAEKWLMSVAASVPEVRRLESLPGIGRVRAAIIVSIVVSPHRFRRRQHFWSYSGLGVEVVSSSDWKRTKLGSFVRKQEQQHRGLAHGNTKLKCVFKGAAVTVIASMREHPLTQHYQRMIESGIREPLARLTIARRIAAATLAIWKNKEDYDATKQTMTVVRSAS